MNALESMTKRMMVLAALVTLTSTSVLGQDVLPPEELVEAPKEEYSPFVDDHFPTRPLFGDTHLHTSWSADAVRGAAAGALIGEIASDDAGKGAAYGAAVGMIRGRRKARSARQEAEEAAEQQGQQAQEATAEKLGNFKKAFSVCLEAKDYMVKF